MKTLIIFVSTFISWNLFRFLMYTHYNHKLKEIDKKIKALKYEN